MRSRQPASRLGTIRTRTSAASPGGGLGRRRNLPRPLVAAVAAIAAACVQAGPAGAGVQERKLEVMSELVMQWPRRFRAEALEVIDCETGSTYDPHAIGAGGLYYGLFQQGAWQRATYGFGWSIRAQVRSGLRAFLANGRCWTCNAQWPVCGRGLD